MNLGSGLPTLLFCISDLYIKQTSGSITDTNKGKIQFLSQGIYDSTKVLKNATSRGAWVAQ